MVVGLLGEPGTGVLWHVAVAIKLDRGHVPILLHKEMAMTAKECSLNPNLATYTFVQVRRPLNLTKVDVDLAVHSFGINDPRSLA